MSKEKIWKDKENQELREIEEGVRDEVNGIDPFSFSGFDEGEEWDDDRDYVDRMFKDFSSQKGIGPKKVIAYNCQGNVVPDLPKEQLAVLFNYKLVRTQGKRDPLSGNHVMAIPTPKGHHMVPLHLLRKYALNIIRLSDAAEDRIEELDMDLVPEVDW
jgi:hypothetical protein